MFDFLYEWSKPKHLSDVWFSVWFSACSALLLCANAGCVRLQSDAERTWNAVFGELTWGFSDNWVQSVMLIDFPVFPTCLCPLPFIFFLHFCYINTRSRLFALQQLRFLSMIFLVVAISTGTKVICTVDRCCVLLFTKVLVINLPLNERTTIGCQAPDHAQTSNMDKQSSCTLILNSLFYHQDSKWNHTWYTVKWHSKYGAL